MTKESSRYIEDYITGSSDYPWPRHRKDNEDYVPHSEHRRTNKPRKSLTDKLQGVRQSWSLNPDGSINVDETNKKRVNYAVAHSLKPVIRDKYGLFLYRVVTIDESGLFRINYQEQPHEFSEIDERFKNIYDKTKTEE